MPRLRNLSQDSTGVDAAGASRFAVYFATSAAILFFTVSVNEVLGQALLLTLIAVGMALGRITLMTAVGLTLPYMTIVSAGVQVNVSLVDLFIPLVVLAAVRSCWTNSRYTRVAILPLAFALLFVVWSGVGLISLPIRTGAAPENLSFLLAVSKLCLCFMLFSCLAVLTVRDVEKGRLDLVESWVATATATACVATFEIAVRGGSEVRFTAGFDNPNLLGLYLVVSLGLAVVWRMLLGKGLIGLEMMPMFFGILSTGSRGSLAAAATFVLLLPFLAGARGKALASFTTAAAVMLSTAIILLQRDDIFVLQRITSPGGSLAEDDRGALWALAVDLWHQWPIVGIGLGQFAQISQQYTGASLDYNAHNTYLSVLVETGLIGAVLFFSLLMMVIIRFTWAYSALPNILIVACVFIPLLVNMATMNAENVRFVWAFLSICFALGVARNAAPDDESNYIVRGSAGDDPERVKFSYGPVATHVTGVPKAGRCWTE